MILRHNKFSTNMQDWQYFTLETLKKNGQKMTVLHRENDNRWLAPWHQEQNLDTNAGISLWLSDQCFNKWTKDAIQIERKPEKNSYWASYEKSCCVASLAWNTNSFINRIDHDLPIWRFSFPRYFGPYWQPAVASLLEELDTFFFRCLYLIREIQFINFR